LAWERERERQKDEFTITEKDLDAHLRMPSPEVRSTSEIGAYLVSLFCQNTYCTNHYRRREPETESKLKKHANVSL